jgi:signal peptidase I
MEPAFYRGDLLFLTNPASERYHTGDITVYKIPGADIPIVHRVLETHDVSQKVKIPGSVFLIALTVIPLISILRIFRLDTKYPGDQLLLTKGDNNYVDDIELYQGLDWLEKKHIVGKVRGYVDFIPSPYLSDTNTSHPQTDFCPT